jgi:DNA-binding transcriptional LysR family regulator
MLVLAAAVREGSLAAAARSLGITASAASQAVSALEAQVGEPLLTRGRRGISPTAAGERIAAHGEAIRAQLEAAESGFTGPTTLRIAAFATSVVALVAPALAQLRASAPTGTTATDQAAACQMTVTEVEPDEARVLLGRGRVDLALVNHSAHTQPDADGRWRVEHILDERLDLVMSVAHRLAARRTVGIADLADDPWVMQAPASPCQEVMMRACAEAGFAPRVVATCATYTSILALVATGQGVALVPRLVLAGGVPRSVSVVRTRVSVLRRVNALTPRGIAHPAGLDALVAALRDAGGVARPD